MIRDHQWTGRAVFDVDGTIADDRLRGHYLRTEPKDWDGYFSECALDIPIYPIVRLCQSLHLAGYYIALWTGRSDKYRVETMKWLTLHDIDYQELRMRPAADHRPDKELKGEWLGQQGWMPDLMFEDRLHMVEFWRSKGRTCLDVAGHDF